VIGNAVHVMRISRAYVHQERHHVIAKTDRAKTVLPPLSLFCRQPSKKELQPFLDRNKDLPKYLRVHQKQFAIMEWRQNVYKNNPNEFWHTEPPDGYKEGYLAGNLWKSIKQKVLKAANHKCIACPSKANTVHHRDYRPSTMSGEDLQYLVAICNACHTRIHSRGDDTKRDPTEWDKVLIDAVTNDQDSN